MNKPTNATIAYYRLLNQQIAQQQFKAPHDMVKWMGITQAQDYAGAKWSIGLRLPGATDATIEQAIADKGIVRSWAFRGTLHFMAPEDIRWMLQLAAPRVIPSLGTHFRRFELDKATLAKSRIIMTAALKGGEHLTRKELMAAIQKKNISTEGLRSNFFMLSAALEGLICCGVRRSKEFTYTLLDEWLPQAPKLTRNEALANLALRYFTSHGPATIPDFAWWLGITLADARTSLETVKDKLEEVPIDDAVYYLPQKVTITKPDKDAVFLLPGFDEYLLGYKDRSAVLSPEHAGMVVGSGNGLFSSTIIVNGQVAGVWKRTLKKDTVIMDTTIFTPITKTQSKNLAATAKRYSEYIGLSLKQA